MWLPESPPLPRAGLQISGSLAANAFDKIPHSQIHVEQVKPPLSQNLTVGADVTGDIVGTRVFRVALNGDLQVIRMVIARAACAE